jgi:hypothetical protein
MSRCYLVALVALTAAPAAAKIVIRGPELAYSCPMAKSLDAIAACIKQHGWTSKIVHAFGHARLFDVNAPMDPFERAHERDPDLALYVQQGGVWVLGGLFEPGSSTAYELLDAQELTIGHTHGYRIEVGTTTEMSVSLDTLTTVPMVELVKYVLYCSGTSFRCTQVVPACDALIEGRVYATFHGDVRIADREVRVDGDSTLASPLCLGTQSQPLDWQ